jgi:hypothetical protein
MKHFCVDVETLGVESTCVVLSAAIVYFDFAVDTEITYEELVDRSLYVKFNMNEQLEMGRSKTKSTIEWWQKQGKEIQKLCLFPSPKDLSADEGIRRMKNYIAEHGEKNSLFWQRGVLDQMSLESLCRSIDVEPITMYNQWMDIRTGIRILKETSNQGGYCPIPNFDTNKVMKHNPVEDIALDVLMLVHGE